MEYTRYFGEVFGHPEGSWYPSRHAVRRAGLHAENQGGISGRGHDGADAIVLSGGYDDDEDHGDVVVYTGQGGNRDGKQIADQSFEYRGNAGLVKSENENFPVRVIRGPVQRSPHAPAKGYQYGGLYRVVHHWYKQRDDGFRVCQYLMVKIGTFFDSHDIVELFPERLSDSEVETFSSGAPAERVPRTVKTIQRRLTVRENVKDWHQNTCQVCSQSIALPLGPTSETAHIRPLGKPHNGPDEETNALCLCPNDHVRFDHGALYLQDDFEIIDRIGDRSIGELRRHPKHKISTEHIRYHRSHWTSN